MANFVYLLVDEKTRDAMVIDSGWETEPIMKVVGETGAKVRYVVATHEHFDHVSTISELAARVGAKVVAHRDSPLDCDLRVVHRQQLMLGDRGVTTLHTPGHTDDSICLYDGREVFTGDTLFVGTIGRFERPRADSMYDSLYNVILRLPGSTMMYPGHDYGEVPFRKLSEEKTANPFLMTPDVRSFLSLFA